MPKNKFKKNVKDLQPKKFKTVSRGIKENLINGMRGNELCPRFERVNMVQTKFIYRFKAISIKIPIVCVCV